MTQTGRKYKDKRCRVVQAYEDTGLTPAEIAAMQAENENLRSVRKALESDLYNANMNLEHTGAELAAYRQAEQEGRMVGTCTMTCQDEDSEHWQCSCGSEWTYECGNPIDNSVKYCHECGAKVVSVRERRYSPETDEYEEIELMQEARAALDK